MLVLRRYIGESITITNDKEIEITLTLLEIIGTAAMMLIVCDTPSGKYAVRASAFRHLNDQARSRPISLMPTMDSTPIEIIVADNPQKSCVRIGIQAADDFKIKRTELGNEEETERIVDVKASKKANAHIKEVQEQV